MLLTVRNFCTKVNKEIYSHSTVRVFRQKSQKIQNSTNPSPAQEPPPPRGPEYRENEIEIQMLSRNLYEQVFGSATRPNPDASMVKKCISELQKHGIKVGENAKLKDVVLKLPPLKGSNIEEHFMAIASEQSGPYKKLVESILEAPPPAMPAKWSFTAGWTCYDGSRAFPVDYPAEEALVFDVEVCVGAGQGPVVATAVGPKCWYSWVSPRLIDLTSNATQTTEYFVDDLIPLGNDSRKIVVGHNVSFDRARVKEQYLIEENKARFLDTMSLHVCISGVTSYQRALLKSSKELSAADQEWSSQSSLNSLKEVYKLYCKKELSKEARDIFVNGTLQDVVDDFQNLMNYCANDVVATREVLDVQFPMFCERFPHPATLAGMLEIGSAYLPLNSNWKRYIMESNLTYEDLDIESKYHLRKKADEACQLLNDERYKNDLWMWDQDWSLQELKLKKPLKKLIKANREEGDFQHLYDMKSLLPARRALMPGYPSWYRKLCAKPDTAEWSPGPMSIGTGMQVTPKLLSLCWEGYPLHYMKGQGWGFLVPFQQSHPEHEDATIPIAELVKKCPVIETVGEASQNESNEALGYLWKDVESNLSRKDVYSKAKDDKTGGKYEGTGVWCNTALEGCCWFFKLPHKNGPAFRVGNPLAKDFLNKFSENVLTGDGGKSAERVIEIARMLSYWRNNRDRIMGQMAVWLTKNNLPRALRNSEMEYGAIIPQVVVCGTLTRRAMEPTWMTASNAQRERVGSELRSMIQAPKGYKIVGADVDSQELWIASVLGDAYATGMHGATPFGWMTLSGTKSSGTDMHSMTAKAVGISRDHAKVINYARIYGAGQNFAERLLKQFNPTISDTEAKSKAMKMFALTKGKRWYHALDEFQTDLGSRGRSGYEALKIAAQNNKAVPEMFGKPQWIGGTESAMFNRLEKIANNASPVTPFLSCRLSRSLEPKDGVEDRFLPTRVNWVVQSGAVDFLHLMLVSMRWLMGPNVKFCLSFHDELRYLVKDEMAYKAAVAMHVTNLLTRSFCSHRIGLTDLPQSVAFFSAVEVDTVLRKESSMDSKTPSNPHGLQDGYGIPKGQSLDIYEALERSGENDLSKWEWHASRTKRK